MINKIMIHFIKINLIKKKKIYNLKNKQLEMI